MRQFVLALMLCVVFPLIACGQATDSRLFSMDVTPAPLLILNTSPLPPAQLSVSYSTTMLAQGGLTPYVWDIPPSSPGPLPAGLVLDTNTGEIAGTPSATGLFSFDIRVTDNGGQATIKRFESGGGIGKSKKLKTG